MLKALVRQGWRIEKRGAHVLAFDPSGSFRPLVFGGRSDGKNGGRTKLNNISEIKKRQPNFDFTGIP